MKNKLNRQDQILQELLCKSQVNVEALSRRFGVNTSTIRRDLEQLERKNLLKRIHGGAVPVDALSYYAFGQGLTFRDNITDSVDEKTAISMAAAAMISRGESISISPGTTTTILARAIRNSRVSNLTVVTNAVNIAMELAGSSEITLVLTGGILLSDFFALAGPITESNLAQMHVDKAFIGVTGFSLTHGLTGPNQLEAHTHLAAMENAKEVIVLADHSKLNQVALYTVAPLEKVHVLITDSKAPKPLLKEIKDRGIRVITA